MVALLGQLQSEHVWSHPWGHSDLWCRLALSGGDQVATAPDTAAGFPDENLTKLPSPKEDYVWASRSPSLTAARREAASARGGCVSPVAVKKKKKKKRRLCMKGSSAKKTYDIKITFVFWKSHSVYILLWHICIVCIYIVKYLYIIAFTKLNKNVNDRTFSQYTLIIFSTCIDFPKITLLILTVH